MKLKVLFSIFLYNVRLLTACSSTTQNVVSDEVIFYGEGKYWNVSYIYNPELYEEKKVNWVEIELKDLELSQEDINNIDIEFEGNYGLITGMLEIWRQKLKVTLFPF